MKFLRASEKGAIGEVSACLLRYPTLAEHVSNPCDCSGDLAVKLRRVRARAVHLASEHALGELGRAREALQGDDPD
eukprot:7561230-Pyramimonas_sp.AAC.1